MCRRVRTVCSCRGVLATVCAFIGGAPCAAHECTIPYGPARACTVFPFSFELGPRRCPIQGCEFVFNKSKIYLSKKSKIYLRLLSTRSKYKRLYMHCSKRKIEEKNTVVLQASAQSPIELSYGRGGKLPNAFTSYKSYVTKNIPNYNKYIILNYFFALLIYNYKLLIFCIINI